MLPYIKLPVRVSNLIGAKSSFAPISYEKIRKPDQKIRILHQFSPPQPPFCA